MREKLENEGYKEEEIDEKVEKAEKILMDKLNSGKLELES